MNFIKKVSLLLILLVPFAAQSSEYTAGTDYDQLAKPVSTQTGDKIEVLEFFW